MPKLYIGCALTNAPESFIVEVELLKETLACDFEVLAFIGKTQGTNVDVYNWDIQHCVTMCDIMIAICDYPSLGLGYEIATAVEAQKKPVLALAHNNASVSRLILGVTRPNYLFRRYSALSDVPVMVNKFVAALI